MRFDKMKAIAGKTIDIGAKISAIIAVLIALYGLAYPASLSEKLDIILDRSAQDSDNLGRIAEATSGSAREISQDPIQQLVKRGYGFRTADFFAALRQRDYTSAELFCQAAPENWLQITKFSFAPDPEQRQFFTACQKRSNFVECDTPTFNRTHYMFNSGAERLLAFEEKTAMPSDLCGRRYVASIRKELDRVDAQRQAEDLRACQQIMQDLERIAATADRESWNSTSQTERSYQAEVDKLHRRILGRSSAYVYCTEVAGFDLMAPKRQLRARWESGGKSKP